MGLLGALAGLLGFEAEAVIEQIKEQAVAFSVIGLFGVIAVVFLLIAADIGLTGWIGPLWAAIAIALAAIVIALVIFIALRVQMAARQRRRAEQRRQTESTAMATAALTVLPELLENPLVRNVGVPVAIYAALLLFAPKRKK